MILFYFLMSDISSQNNQWSYWFNNMEVSEHWQENAHHSKFNHCESTTL